MKWRTLGILAALAAAGVAAALWLGRAQPIVVDTVEVGRGPVAETVTNTRAGTVEACRRAKLAPPAGGQIARLLVKKGDRVQADQVLLELWNDDVRAELTVAERDAAASGARREEACVAARVARRESGRLASLVEAGAECATCRFREWCQGFFKWPDPAYRCDGGMIPLLARIEDSAAQLSRDLDEARALEP